MINCLIEFNLINSKWYIQRRKIKPNYDYPVMDANLATTSQEEVIGDLAMILVWKCQLCSAAAKRTNRTLGIIWKSLRA